MKNSSRASTTEGRTVRFRDEKTSNKEDVERSLEFVKEVLSTRYGRGDRVDIKVLFQHVSKAPPELVKYCGKDMKEFRKTLAKHPDIFVINQNFVSLNVREKVVSTETSLVDSLENAQQAVQEICRHREFGLKILGTLWGLTGKAAVLAIVLPTGRIYLFDLVLCPQAVTETDLAKLIQSEEVLKICHACQNDAGALYSNFGLQLRNVFDTQCAFKTVQYSNPRMLDENLTPHMLNLYNIMDYIELKGEELYYKEEAVKALVRKDEGVWTKRPLNQKLLEYAAASVKALPLLYREMKPAWALKANKVLFENLVYEEIFRFLTPLIVKRRQNMRQGVLRNWRRKNAIDRRLAHYVEKNGKEMVWNNDYNAKPAVTVPLKHTGDPKAASGDPPTTNTILDLASKFFLSNNKRYYFDIKEQNGVRFVKISEVSSVDQTRNLISINVSLMGKFRDVLEEMQRRRMPPFRAGRMERVTTLIHSITIVKDTRRYLVDLKRNRWGYFVMISQMLPTGGKLSSIAFNIQDLKTFVQIFHDIGEEWGGEDPNVSEGSYMRFRNKRYFFNVNQNPRGAFMRISEIVSPNYQSSMVIAEPSWDEFLYNFTRTINAFRKSHAGSTQQNSSPPTSSMDSTPTTVSTSRLTEISETTAMSEATKTGFDDATETDDTITERDGSTTGTDDMTTETDCYTVVGDTSDNDAKTEMDSISRAIYDLKSEIDDKSEFGYITTDRSTTSTEFHDATTEIGTESDDSTEVEFHAGDQ